MVEYKLKYAYDYERGRERGRGRGDRERKKVDKKVFKKRGCRRAEHFEKRKRNSE